MSSITKTSFFPYLSFSSNNWDPSKNDKTCLLTMPIEILTYIGTLVATGDQAPENAVRFKRICSLTYCISHEKPIQSVISSVEKAAFEVLWKNVLPENPIPLALSADDELLSPAERNAYEEWAEKCNTLNKLTLEEKKMWIQDSTNTNHIEYLCFLGEKLKIVPPQLKHFSNLKGINFPFNEIKMLPEFLGKLPKLEEIYFDADKIKTLPSSLNHFHFTIDEKYHPDIGILQKRSAKESL